VSDRARSRSLFWPVAGAFLLAAVVGAALQLLGVIAVLKPIEAREARAHAELAVSAIASAYAAAPVTPAGAELDSLLHHAREQAAVRPGVIVLRLDDGTTVTSPSDFVRILPRVLADSARDAGDRGRNEIIAHHALVRGDRRVGEVFVLHRTPRGPGPESNPLPLLLYFPIAALLSGALALVIVRMLVRRLGALERLAARVAAGDMSVRVADTSGDEIGRVAAQLDGMTERLAAARDSVAATEQQRRQLFADITHELATPLTSIRGAAETMLDPDVPMNAEDRTRYVRGILDESRRLDRLIRDLFELARLEAGAAPLEKERLDWAALCRNTIERFEPRYARANLVLSWRGEPREVWVVADGMRLEQALDNLLVNALRYVPDGGHVTAGLERADDARWRLTVTDDGPGLPPDQMAHVFERFYRGASARGGARDAGGSGLGLAIVREIVERHGGAVRARSAEPRGLTVEIELPAA